MPDIKLPKGFKLDEEVKPPKGFTLDEKKNETLQSVAPTGTQTSKRGFEPFLPQVPTKTPSVLLSDEQKQQREKQRIGERFETTLLNVPTEFGKVDQFMRSAKKVKDTLPQIPTIKPSTGGMVVIPQGEKIGDSLRKGDTLQDELTDKLTSKKTALQKQIENAENAFRAYQGDEIANQAQGYVPPEETLKIKQELGFGEKMSNAGSNFVNKLERFVPNTALALGQTLTTLLGEDYGSDAYRMITASGNADIHRMEAFDKLAKLDAEYKYSKGLIQSVQDLDLGGVAAAVTDAVGSLISTVVTSAPTAGLGLYADMVGSGLYDYNSTKANRLGITVEQLYDSGQNDFFVPAILGGVGAQLEKIGLKGIKQGILSNIKSKAGQKAGLIFHNSNKEGFTEWTQSGLEAYSNSLAQGKNAIQAGEEAVKEMFSKKGAESYLMGAVAAGAAIGGGRILRGIVSSREKKKAADALQKIEQQQQELSNPDISEESRVFIFDNIKNNVKEFVDAVYADVDESENLGENQKKEVFELNKTIQALEIVANDPAVSEETKASAQTRIDELKSKVDGIIATPEIKLAKPTFDTEEQLVEEIRAAEREFNETGDSAEYQLKINDLNTRLENLVPAPEVEVAQPTEEAEIESKKADIEKRIEEDKKQLGKKVLYNGSDRKFVELTTRGPIQLEDIEGKNEIFIYIKQSDGSVKFGKAKRDTNGLWSWSIAPIGRSGLSDNELFESLSGSKIRKAEVVEERDYDAELAELETPKPQEDAVQVETAGQVPVLTEAPVGEEVEQGKPQPKAKVVAEEGKEEINPIDKDKGFDNPDFISYNGMFSKEKATSISQTDIIADEVQGAKGYHFFYKGKKSRIEMMSPDEYLKRVREGFKTNKDENILDSSKANINEGVEKGDKIDMPSLDYSNNSFNQEGRNRSLFAKERGERLIPVLIIEDASMADRIAKAKEILSSVKTKENTTESLIQEAKNKFNLHRDAVEFMRRNIDEIKPELVQEKTPAQEVKRLRAKEQAELYDAIPNADQYLTDGKVDRAKIADAKDLKKYDEIYDKYDELITPLLPKSETKAEPIPAKPKAEPRLKPRVETRIKFTKAIELFNDISATKGGAKKRTLSSKRRTFLEQNPSIKYIDDNWKSISKQLEDKGLLKKEGNCP